MSGPGVYLEKPVRPDSYVSAVRSCWGWRASMPRSRSRRDLRRSLDRALSGADREALQRALEALRKK